MGYLLLELDLFLKEAQKNDNPRIPRAIKGINSPKQ